MSDLYEVYAIRYATRDAKRADHFIGGDPHDAPMPMDYFVWVAKSPKHTFVIDTGFTAEVAAQRKRTYLRCPVESLKLIGVDPAAVKDVIQTHLHYDHVGNFAKFPKARFHLAGKGDAVRHGPLCQLRQARPFLRGRRHLRHGPPELRGTRRVL